MQWTQGHGFLLETVGSAATALRSSLEAAASDDAEVSGHGVETPQHNALQWFQTVQAQLAAVTNAHHRLLCQKLRNPVPDGFPKDGRSAQVNQYVAN